MITYVFITEATVTASIEVETNSLSDAVAQAKCAYIQSQCGQCSSATPGEWHLDDDGDPRDTDLADCVGADIGAARALWEGSK